MKEGRMKEEERGLFKKNESIYIYFCSGIMSFKEFVHLRSPRVPKWHSIPLND